MVKISRWTVSQVDEVYKDKMNIIKAEKKARHRIQKRQTHMYHQDGVYIAPLLMEIFLI